MRLGNLELVPRRIGIVVTTLLTVVIHIGLGEPLFILNGVGYLTLWAGLFLPVTFLYPWQKQIRWIFIGYVLLTIVLFFVLHPDGSWQEDELGVATKFIEVLLLLLLIYDGQETRPAEE